MSDKIRLIYNKIENRIDEICDDGFVSKENQQEYETLTDLEDFIDSLPKEPTSEGLEKEVHKHLLNIGATIEMYSGNVMGLDLCEDDYVDFARHFAEWQKKKDQETIELAEDHAMLDGMMKEREEMMKDAVEVEVEGGSFIRGLGYKGELKKGDKVKIIIVKE